MIGAGVDVGSTQTKAVLMDDQMRVVARALINTGAHVGAAAERAYREALERAGLGADDVAVVLGTGYGRFRVTFGDDQVTEIACHARGAHFLFPGTRTVVDMGGQDTKAIRVGPSGEVVDFCMNDKCAAGTGRFLAAAAEVLGLTLDQLGPRALGAERPIRLTSTCAVFVEADIMSFLARGETVENILGGVHRAIAARTAALVRRVGVEPEVTFTGGVSRNPAMVRALGEALGAGLNSSPDSHFMGAIGAALFALQRAGVRSPRAGAAVPQTPTWEDGL